MTFDGTEFTFGLAYAGMIAAAVYLFRRAPDTVQRIAMLIAAFGFALQSAMLFVAAFNGADEEMRLLIWFLRRTGREFMQTAFSISILRLVWKEWVRGPLKQRSPPLNYS